MSLPINSQVCPHQVSACEDYFLTSKGGLNFLRGRGGSWSCMPLVDSLLLLKYFPNEGISGSFGTIAAAFMISSPLCCGTDLKVVASVSCNSSAPEVDAATADRSGCNNGAVFTSAQILLLFNPVEIASLVRELNSSKLHVASHRTVVATCEL